MKKNHEPEYNFRLHLFSGLFFIYLVSFVTKKDEMQYFVYHGVTL